MIYCEKAEQIGTAMKAIADETESLKYEALQTRQNGKKTRQNTWPIYRVFQGECATLRENVPYVKIHRYNPKHLRISEGERLRR